MRLLIPSLKIPKIHPTERALLSFKETIEDYSPSKWQDQYLFARYLLNLKNDALITRYKSITENMQFYIDNERNQIPIKSYDSSWYWYRKEFQTRLEFYLRKIPFNKDLAKPQTYSKRNLTIGTSNKIYRYGKKKYIEEMYSFGKIRFSIASTYKTDQIMDPRTDDELNKLKYSPNYNTKIVLENGKQIPIIGDLQITTSAPNYYTLCLSTEYNEYMYEKFDYDSCLIVKNIPIFQERIELVIKEKLPNWYFEGLPVQYFDPYEHSKNEIFDAVLSKDFKFAYQKEYRIFCDPLSLAPAKEPIDIEVGNLSDICEIKYHE